MISVENVTMRFGARVLFEDVTTTFMAGRRYAISGPNGAGKSTFMKILTGEQDATHGTITRPKKIGILRQDQFAFDKFRVIDTVIMGNATLWKALQEREALYAKPHDELTDADGMRLGELEGIVGEENGYTAEADAGVLLDGLGIEADLHERKMGELQGGQKVRVLLAQALFGNPSALLLDEPTNNLDPSSIEAVGTMLSRWPGTIVVVSHDRAFVQALEPTHRLALPDEVFTHWDDIHLDEVELR
jgi:ATPase subunit of ABC transporter with duplicated ATPase domains